MKNNFEKFLQEKHAENYHGLDDDMVDAFEHWLTNLDTAEVMEYADLFAEALLKAVEERVDKLCTHFPVREDDSFDDGRVSMKREVKDVIATLK